MASDTSLVFNLLGKDKISGVLAVVKNAFRSTAQTAEDAMSKASVSTDRLDNQINDVKRHLAELNAEFALTGDKTLFGKMARDRSLLTNLQKVRAEVQANNDEANKSDFSRLADQFKTGASAIGSAASAIGNFGSTVGSVTSSVWGIVSAIGAFTGALAAVGPGLALAGGAIGSLPGLLSGGVAGIGALKLGVTGLSEEYKRLTTTTGGAAQAQKDVTAATRGVQSAVEELARAEREVTTAQQDALAAQQAINAARETAAKRLRDQSLDLQTAQLDQKDATDQVAQAQGALDMALARGGDPTAVDKAREALDRAKIAAAQAKNKVDDLTEANAKNAKTGVEGSDEVVQAKKQEADARQKVADSIQAEHDAELRLQDARKSLADQQTKQAGGGAGQQITELAPAARAFLNTILGLRPAFTDLRLDVQQKLFAGLAGPIQQLAQKWLPQLHATLGQFAGTFNDVAKTAIATAGKKSFITDMAAGANGVRVALGEVGKVAAGPLQDAFGRLARASVPFVEKLGHLLAGTLDTFSRWIRKADESGKLKSFFEGAASTLEKVWTIGTKVGQIIGQVIGIIFGQAKSSGDSVLDSANNALTNISTWLKDPKNQALIRGVVSDIEGWGRSLGGFIRMLGDLKIVATIIFNGLHIAISFSSTLVNLTTNAVFGLAQAFKGMWSVGTQVWNAISSAAKATGHALGSVWDSLKDGFRSAINWIISRWNSLSFRLPSVNLPFLGEVGGQQIGLGQIPYLANGGITTAAGMAVVGERGPELVSLQRGAQVIPLQPNRGGQVLVVDIRGGDGDLKRMIRNWIRTDNLLNS